jgi:hypothetical protein
VTSTEVDALRAEGPWSQARWIGYRSPVVEGPDVAVVQPWWSNPIRRQVHAELPDDLRALASDAIGRSAGAPTDDLASWLRAEREMADRRRRAHAADVRSVLIGEPSPLDVTVLCVTRRPALLDAAIDNVARQTIGASLVLVTNDAGFDAAAVDRTLARVPGAVHLHRPAEVTLGECLSTALDASATRFVAKFDDDDHYDDTYLVDQLQALAWSGAAVVGKAACLAYLDGSDRTIVRHPEHEHRAVGFVAGGTIVADRSKIGDARFPAGNTGEDSGFLAACESNGAVVVSSSCLGYVQFRGADNTWAIDDDRFAHRAWVLGAGSPDGCFVG